jgi:hypothetical protein
MEQNYVQKLIIFPYFDWGYESTNILIRFLYEQVTPATNKVISAPKVIDRNRLDEAMNEWKDWLL